MLKTLRTIFDAKFLLSSLLVVSPWLVLVVGAFFSGHSIIDSVPVWSDELAYWHEIFSLSQKGFNHGYYTYNEAIPTFSVFGSHGFGTILCYAVFAKLFGWKVYSMVVANAFYMLLAFLFLVLSLKPAVKQLIFIFLIVVTFVPYLLFSVTSMSEGLNYALLIVYFTLIYRFVKQGGKRLFFLILTVCTVFSFVRIIYIVLFCPLIFINNKEVRFSKRVFLYIPIWLVFSAVLFFINGLFVAPYPDSFLHELFITSGITEKTELFVSHFLENCINFLSPFSDSILQVLERYVLLLILIYSFLKSGILRFNSKKIKIQYFIVFLILVLVLLITISAYDVFDWRDYRVFAPVLLGSMLFLIMFANKFELYNLLIINFIVFVFMISSQAWNSFTEGRFTKTTEIALLRCIEYNDTAKNNFVNTVAIQSFSRDVVMNVPAGIGITVVDSLSDELKSKYIFSSKKLNIKTYKILNSDNSGYLYVKKL